MKSQSARNFKSDRLPIFSGLWRKVSLDYESFVIEIQRQDGLLMKPIGWQAGKTYPMVLSIHGGPAGMYGFDFFHEFQIYAASGWAVFFTNPRGSTGYGEKSIEDFKRGTASMAAPFRGFLDVA